MGPSAPRRLTSISAVSLDVPANSRATNSVGAAVVERAQPVPRKSPTGTAAGFPNWGPYALGWEPSTSR